MRLSRKNSRGFTLIELLVVIAIIGILASVTLTSLNGARARARDTQRMSELKEMQKALELFYLENGHYPDLANNGVSESGEFIGDNNGPIEQALDPYFDGDIPVDPRHDGSIYYYAYDARHCEDDPIGACNCVAVRFPVISVHTLETDGAGLNVRKDTCSGGDMSMHQADMNIVLDGSS